MPSALAKSSFLFASARSAMRASISAASPPAWNHSSAELSSRPSVQPGQASSYMLGHQVWSKSRDAARDRLGLRFDIKAFHDAGLLTGSMPLTVLEAHLAEWANSRLSG